MKSIGTLALLAAIASLGVGCATMGGGMSDEEMIRATLDDMKTALLEQDKELFLAAMSDDFYHPEVGGKTDIEPLLDMVIDSGYLEGGEVFMDQMEITINEDGTATVYPVDLVGAPGSISVEVVLKKEEDRWLITTVYPDGL